jgi:hypothetical protein
MSTEGERLQVSVLPYRCSICPFCCVGLGCCAAEFRNSGGTYELLCIMKVVIRNVLRNCNIRVSPEVV